MSGHLLDALCAVLMRLLLFIALCALAACSGPARTSTELPSPPTAVVAGHVVDDLGEPVPGADIAVAGDTLRTSTDLDGFYVLRLPPGRYNLTVAYPGYEQAVSAPVQLDRVWQTESADFTLEVDSAAVEAARRFAH